jgi:hypothetical protein
VHSADGWRAVLEPVIARYRGTVKRRYFRGDAAFANDDNLAFPDCGRWLAAEGDSLIAKNVDAHGWVSLFASAHRR